MNVCVEGGGVGAGEPLAAPSWFRNLPDPPFRVGVGLCCVVVCRGGQIGIHVGLMCQGPGM